MEQHSQLMDGGRWIPYIRMIEIGDNDDDGGGDENKDQGRMRIM